MAHNPFHTEALEVDGTKEGQTLIVRDPNSKTPILYQWSMAARKWEKVGEVMGGKDDGGSGATLGSRMFEGKEYDYLFDIDINGKYVKLPFNRGDDPWMTAQQWIWKNDIDQACKPPRHASSSATQSCSAMQ